MAGSGPGGRRACRALAAGLVLIVLVAARSASADTSDCHQSVSTETCTFSYTGSEQTFVVPAGVTDLSITAVGAAGGAGENSSGGAGGKATVDQSVTPGETLYVEVGSVGGINSAGWNGGGLGNAGGGGASDVRTVSCGSDCASGGGGASLASRLVVGGGGGGGAEPGNTPGGIPAGGTGGDAGNDGTAGGDTGGYGDSGGGGGGATLSAGGTGGTAGTNALGETTMDPGHDGQAGASGAGGAGGADAVGFPDGDPGGGGGGGYFGGGGGGSAANGAELQTCSIPQPPPLPPLQTLCNVPVVSAGGGGGGGSSYAPGGTVVAADGSASVTISYTLPPAPPAITSDGQTTFTAGTAGSFTVTASGSPAPAFQETGDLPAGVTFVDNGDGTATLSGTPAADTEGTYPLTIGASNGNAPDASQNFTLTVDESPAITSADAATFPVGADGTFTVTTTGSPTPALSENGALPAGVTFVDNGDGTATLSGTPAADSSGTYPLTIGASNGIAPDASQDFTLTVDEAPAVTSANHTSFGMGEAGSFTVTTAGHPTPSLSEIGVPAWVTFVDNHDGTATLSGTPTAAAAASYPLTIGASNGVTPDASQSFTLTVVAASLLPHVTSVSPMSGAAGAHVTLVGTVLNAVTAIDFANSASHATIVSRTATTLVVSVPGDAAAGPITITTGVGHFTTSQSFKPVPKVASLSAYDGQAGNLVRIFGTNLDDASAVKFGTVSATPIAVSATEVDAHVPLTVFSSGAVSVTTPGGTAASTQAFAITKITGFSPTSGKANTVVTITGQGLASTTKVDFIGSGTDATFVGTPTATTVKVLVPPDADTGDIVVNTQNTTPGSIHTATAFKPTPSITSVSPADGLDGTPVAIHGANFLHVAFIKFGTVEQDAFTVPNATEVDTTVPGGFVSGPITVVAGGGTVVATDMFTITKVTGFSPTSAASGATITITGQGLGDTSSIDFIGHSHVTQLTKTATSVKVVVPPEAIPGALELHTPNADIPLTPPLKVVPTITSVTPADGQPGTQVTINGTGFFTDVNTVVKFGTISLNTYIVMSANVIKADIPANFTSGAVTVTTPGGGTAVSKTVVTVTTLTGFSPLKATEGSTITITGTGLASTSEVDFVGIAGAPVAGTIVSKSPTAVKVTVPNSFLTPVRLGAITIHTPNLVALAGITSTQSFAPLPALLPLTPTQAGTALLIAGSGLEPTGLAPTVKLGAETVPLLFAFDGGAFGTLPSDAITGTLTVTTPEGSVTAKLLVPPTIGGGPTPSSGTTGTQVQLTGLTFTGTTAVKVNGVSTPFTLSGALGSTQTLTFKIPPTATSGAISVTNAGGTTSSTTFDVTPAIKTFTPTSAPDGATLVVTGTGFGGADLVTFGGGVTAVPSNVTPTSFKVVVPQGAVAGTLTVHTATGGTSAASPTQFTPTATLASFAPTSGPAGTPVTITGAGFTNVTDVLFDGTSVGPGNFHVVSATEIDATVPGGAADGVITVVRSKGGNLTSAASFSVTT